MWLFLEYLDGNLLRIHRRIMSRDQSKVGHEVFYSRNPLACAELNFGTTVCQKTWPYNGNNDLQTIVQPITKLFCMDLIFDLLTYL